VPFVASAVPRRALGGLPRRTRPPKGQAQVFYAAGRMGSPCMGGTLEQGGRLGGGCRGNQGGGKRGTRLRHIKLKRRACRKSRMNAPWPGARRGRCRLACSDRAARSAPAHSFNMCFCLFVRVLQGGVMTRGDSPPCEYAPSGAETSWLNEMNYMAMTSGRGKRGLGTDQVRTYLSDSARPCGLLMMKNL